MTISSRDAWVLRSLICDRSVDDEQRDALPEPWKAMSARLASLAPDDRAAAWDTMLTARPDGDEINTALAEVDPEGEQPPPEAIVEAVASWGPLRIGKPPEAAPFPCDVFPPPLEAFCRIAAESLATASDYVAVSMLAVAGAAIGQSVNLQVKREWCEAALLYAILIGSPGKIKTPAMRKATRPLTDIDTRLRDESKSARELWEEAKKAHAKDENEPPPGSEPPQHRAIVKDITRESLCVVLADNPRGVLCAPDEATAWVGSWNQYKGKGGTDVHATGRHRIRYLWGRHLPMSASWEELASARWEPALVGHEADDDSDAYARAELEAIKAESEACIEQPTT